ncbi:hypothetical protein N431DRAFT_387411 [Stipitochalara longipes BDJ]|nr:hypothetical protein N431DRAFT_387411 [Stipitochalara longipes BDJ]
MMDPPPPYFPRVPLTPQDFETASIRSAAPSYISEAPTYTSLLPSSSSTSSPRPRGLPSPYGTTSSLRNPNIHANSIPSLDAYRISGFPRTHPSNPTARHYHSVASRRASALTIQEQSTLLAAALNGEDGIERMKRRMESEEREREMRTNEDPELVGEEAAKRNREDRERRENGWGVLEKEDKRWDWLLAQMSDWEERDKSWKKFRQELEGGKRAKLAKRLGMGRP